MVSALALCLGTGSLAQQPAFKHSFSWTSESVWQEDFDSLTALNGWRFNPGAEFGPGARGKVALVSVPSGGKALELSYSTKVCDAVKGCPAYAAAVHHLKQPARADNLHFRIKNTLPREARVFALVKDSAGQTFQYRPERCPFETARDEWCKLDVDLRLPKAHWGGANNGLIQGDITEVSVLVQSLDGVRARHPVEGTLQFDDVTLSKGPATVTLAPAGAANSGAAWREMQLDGHTERLGVAVHFRGDRSHSIALLDKASAAGFGLVRTDLFWEHVERTRTSYDFTAADHLVADARERKLKVLFILAYTNPLYKDGVLMSTEAERQAFASYAARAAARFKGQGIRFEIWNEQNSGAACPSGNEGFWLPRPDAQNYSKLVSATMKAIRAVDPQVDVSLGGLTPSFTSPCELTQATQFAFQYLDALHNAGGLNNINALGYHPYYDVPEWWGAELHMLRNQLRQKGFPALPVWETEWGFSSACPDGERPCAQGHTQAKRDRQAVLLARRFLVSLSLNLPVNVWYDLVDDGVNPSDREHHFGLYDTALNGKPALAAMQTLAALSKDHRLSGVVPDLPAGMHAVRFQKAMDTVYALWVDRGSLPLKADTTGLIRAVDVQGRALATSGAWILRESDGPIYLSYRPPAP